MKQIKENAIANQKKIIAELRENNSSESSIEKAILELNLMVDDYEKDNNVVDKENIHLYYESMSDEDLIEIENHNNLVSDVIFNRKMDVYVLLTEEADTKETEWIQCDNILNHEGFVLKYSLFGIKDTLRPIDEYIEEIKESEQYKIFTSECRCNNCMT